MTDLERSLSFPSKIAFNIGQLFVRRFARLNNHGEFVCLARSTDIAFERFVN